MPPTTRSLTKKATLIDTRHIVSWICAVTGETFFYERFHVYDEEGEVLFVQLRMNEQGELVPWTNDEGDGIKRVYLKIVTWMLIRPRKSGP